MSDGRAYDDQALPWLEAVDDEDGPRGISARKMLVALFMVLAAAAIVAGTMFWLGRRDPVVTGAPELIRAEPGPYKVKPDDPGGLDVAGDSETAYSTSAGEDPDAALDVRKLPQEMQPLPAPAEDAPPKKIPPNEKRSEERRVGKECRCRRSQGPENKKRKTRRKRRSRRCAL